MKCVYKVIFIFGMFLPLIATRQVPNFRRDYKYVEEYDAFYKVHWDFNGLTWNSAFLACSEEGAMLFYPKVKGEWALVKKLTENHPNVTEIIVGLHNKYSVGEFITVDGHPTPSPLNVEEPDEFNSYPGGDCVLMNISTGIYRVGSCISHPNAPTSFVCKKTDSESCPTVNEGYIHIKSLKKCYKINTHQKMWDEAIRTCIMEGGTLTVLQNSEEADALRNILEENTKYLVGIQRINPGNELYSVKGQQFNDIYQSPRKNYDKDGDCGIIISNSKIWTGVTSCRDRLPFICEMEV